MSMTDSRQILVIDDDADSVNRLQDHLQAAGFAVTSVDNARDALDIARRQPPDLIITDLRLPGLDGFQFTSALREDPQLASIPVLWMTSYYDLSEIQAQGRFSQADLPTPGVLFKPFKQVELQRRVRAVLGEVIPVDRPHRILVVDDDSSNLELIERRLEVENFDSELVENAATALAALESGAFDAVLLDLRLPDRDGLDLLTEIHATTPWLPIIVMTAHGSESIAASALKQGASDYLIKPVGRRDLITALRRALEMANLRQENRQAQRDLATTLTALQQSKTALEREHQRLRDLLDILDLGVLILNGNGQTERINRAGLRLLHMERPDQAPHSLIAEMRDEKGEKLDTDALCEYFACCRQSETYQLRWTNGEEGALLLTATPLHDQSGTYRGSILVFQDATEMLAQRQHFDNVLRLQEEELHRQDARQRRDRLGGLEQPDDPMLALLSHELRTPLQFIASFSGLLASEASPQLSGRQRQMLDRIQHSAERLGQRLDSLLDLSLLGSDLLQPQPEQVVLAPLIQALIQGFADQAQERGAYIDIQPGRPGLHAWVDPGFCRKILSQLLSNAVKFIGVGGHIQVSLRDEMDQAWVEVRDTGSGMSAGQAAALFDPVASGQQIEGLGLILARRLAESMQASLQVESEPGQGSRFRLLCPVMRHTLD